MTEENSELRRVKAILDQHKDKNFVDRVLNRDKYPFIDLGEGNRATHLMAWTEADGAYRVFPTILFDQKTGKLVKRDNMRDAYDNAVRMGEYIDFNSPDEADWFSQRYKSVWGE